MSRRCPGAWCRGGDVSRRGPSDRCFRPPCTRPASPRRRPRDSPQPECRDHLPHLARYQSRGELLSRYLLPPPACQVAAARTPSGPPPGGSSRAPAPAPVNCPQKLTDRVVLTPLACHTGRRAGPDCAQSSRCWGGSNPPASSRRPSNVCTTLRPLQSSPMSAKERPGCFLRLRSSYGGHPDGLRAKSKHGAIKAQPPGVFLGTAREWPDCSRPTMSLGVPRFGSVRTKSAPCSTAVLPLRGNEGRPKHLPNDGRRTRRSGGQGRRGLRAGPGRASRGVRPGPLALEPAAIVPNCRWSSRCRDVPCQDTAHKM
mmetsp:Transcript_8335/g.18555  ORF Transcript_8335/g.18555 Transcript_8335/m.18555 type:complete len:313 (-) Transcript_8335:378-1316(-)